MKSNYKKIGAFVRQVSSRNTDLSVTNLKGININKEFMPSVANINGTDLSKYKEGQRIYHKRFGEGNISKIEPEGDDLKLDIQFDKVGHKRLMAKFANLEIID